METCRIHITGAAGAGATTLGLALAQRLSAPHHDTDDYFWLPTTRPYTTPRPVADRLGLMHDLFLGRPRWILSGDVSGWGDEAVTPLFDLVVFLRLAKDMRLKRLTEREKIRYGARAVAEGGWRHDEARAFLAWASEYDDGTAGGRSLAGHEAWLKVLDCPVLELDGGRDVADLVAAIMRRLSP